MLGITDQLHAQIIDNNIVKFDIRIVFSDIAGDGQEKSVGEFHDIGFMDGGDFAAVD